MQHLRHNAIKTSKEFLRIGSLRGVACGSELSHKTLFELIQKDERFDREHYWRFDQNRLNQLISGYYSRNPEVFTLRGIYEAEKARKV